MLIRDESILKLFEEELFRKKEGKIIKWKWRDKNRERRKGIKKERYKDGKIKKEETGKGIKISKKGNGKGNKEKITKKRKKERE